jgi:predicted glycosyltransferase
MIAESTATILFQCPNRIGLGHMSRLAAIATTIRETNPAVRVPFVVDGTGHSLLEAFNLPYVSIPGIRFLTNSPVWSVWESVEHEALAMSISEAILKHLKPAIAVFDCFPDDVFFHCAARQQVACILILRRMRDFDQYMFRIRSMLPSLSAILIAHEEGSLRLPLDIERKAIYVGEVVRPDILSEERGNTCKNNSKLIVVTGGGGGTRNSLVLYKLALAAISLARTRDQEIHGLLITGPLFCHWKELNPESGIKIIPFDPEITKTFAQAALVISQAGYNSLTEIATTRVPAICIPIATGFDDQYHRAAEAHNAHPTIELFDGDTSEQLADAILRRLGESPHPLPCGVAAPEGASRVASYLLSLFDRLNHK